MKAIRSPIIWLILFFYPGQLLAQEKGLSHEEGLALLNEAYQAFYQKDYEKAWQTCEDLSQVSILPKSLEPAFKRSIWQIQAEAAYYNAEYHSSKTLAKRLLNQNAGNQNLDNNYLYNQILLIKNLLALEKPDSAFQILQFTPFQFFDIQDVHWPLYVKVIKANYKFRYLKDQLNRSIKYLRIWLDDSNLRAETDFLGMTIDLSGDESSQLCALYQNGELDEEGLLVFYKEKFQKSMLYQGLCSLN